MGKRRGMISIGSAFLSVALLSGVTIAKAAVTRDQDDKCQDEATQTTGSAHQSAFACDRLALDPAARKRHFDEVSPALRALRKAVRELPDGYEFQFPSDPKTIALAAEWAARERVCCPFFKIELRMEAEGGPFWVRVTGRKGTKEFIHADGAAWIRAVN